MAGDTLRDAFRAELDAIIAAASPAITWARVDTTNTSSQPDASTGFIDLEFPGGAEDQLTFGAPAANFYKEGGQVTVRVVAPLRAGLTERNKAESYAEQIRAAFRSSHSRFLAGSRQIRIDATGALGGGHTEGGMWAEAVALSYNVLNIG